MAVPKKRVSKQRQRKRRTHYKADAVVVQACPRCADPTQPHRVCPSCGFYRKKAIFEVDQS